MKSALRATSSTASATRPPDSTSTTAPARERGEDRPLTAGARAPVTAAPTPAARLAEERHRTLGEIDRLLTAYARAVDVSQAPGLHLSPVDTDALAAALGLGGVPTAAAILTAIDRLAAVRIGDIRIPFTPGQLSELQHRAGKRGRTVEQEMRAVVARIEHELFYQGG